MFDELNKALAEAPAPFADMQAAFWDDAHISGEMLKAHLDPQFEGASRKLAFIEQSVDWIGQILPPEVYPRLLDAGCGPGLYAQRLAGRGYRVTGVDISRRSLAYARAQAQAAGQAIRYACQDYVHLHLEETFDAAIMIYCDYGVLPPLKRQKLLANLHRALRPGGRVLLDVFTLAFYDQFQEEQVWEACPNGGFWRKEAYTLLKRCQKYPPSLTLEEDVVLSETGIQTYLLWNQCFTKEAIAQEAEAAGFRLLGVYGDVCGSAWAAESPTMAILMEKEGQDGEERVEID